MLDAEGCRGPRPPLSLLRGPRGTVSEVAFSSAPWTVSRMSCTRARTELIIFIRPQIIRNGSDAQTVAEELRSKLRGSIATTTTNAPITTSYH